MRTIMNRKNVLWGIGVLLLVLSFASGSTAQGRRGVATEVVQDVVAAVDTQAATIEIGGETFSVSERSRLFDAAGRRIALSELRAGTSGDDADMVEFRVTRASDGKRRTIRRLQVVEGDYE